MNKETKTILIVAGVAIVAYLGYQYYQKHKAKTATATSSTAPGAASQPAATNQSVVDTVQQAWNDISNIFS